MARPFELGYLGSCPHSLRVGEEFGESVLGMRADAVEDVAQVSEGIDNRGFSNLKASGWRHTPVGC